MARIAHIVAATDFSPGADRAVRRAASLARLHGGVLHILHVLPPRELLAQFFSSPSEDELAKLRKRADKALQERVSLVASKFAVAPSWALFHGPAHRAILEAAGMLSADLIVIGAIGEHETPPSAGTLGETALKLAQRSQVPVLLVRREPAEPYHAVLACAKGEPIDSRVIGWANELSPGELLHIVSAYTVPYEERLTEWGASKSTIDLYATRERDERVKLLSNALSQLRVSQARARLHVDRGAPLQSILRHAAQLPADLVVIGRRAQTDPLGGSVFGSIARDVAFLAPMDVLIVPPEMTPARAEEGGASSYESASRES